MSAGDVQHKDVPVTAPDDYYARTAELVGVCLVNISHTIPYLANRSTDGKTVYIDREVPEKVAGLASADTLPWHELAEWSAMNDGMDYETAHHTVANPVERQRVEALGGDWTAYEDAYGPLIKEVGDEKIDDVPADLDLRPYEDEDDRKTWPNSQRPATTTRAVQEDHKCPRSRDTQSMDRGSCAWRPPRR